MFKPRARHSKPSLTMEPAIRLWLLRILVPLGAHRELIGAHGFNSDAVAEVLGLAHWIDPDQDGFDPRAVQSALRELHRKAEKQAAKALLPYCLRENIRQLSDLVGLSAIDCRILEFVVSIHSERMLDDAADWLGTLSSVRVFHALSVILDVPESEIRASLSADAILARSGLVSVDRSGTGALRAKLDLLSDDFADQMISAQADPISLLRGTVCAAGPAQLGLAEYGHIHPSLEILCPYLRHAVTTSRRGVNIFVHGAPGTGKTQLARALAKELGCELFEVAAEDTDGDPVSGERRLRAFRAAQSFFAQRRALIVFDEVEDAFNDGDGFLGRKSTAQLRKAWINRMLEENPVATLWLSNSVASLDPAFIRRFDMVFELPVPPQKQRESILRNACGDLLDDEAIARIARTEALAPAVVTKAASVIRAIRGELAQTSAAAAFERLTNNTLLAQGHRLLPPPNPGGLPPIYDPSFIQADADLAAIATRMTSLGSGRLCLYGPPGTGKTAYGHWLAQQMGVPLLIRRASDLMSPWVGENEKNIARAFRQAEDDGALLLIDEVDSFLADRRGAQRGWEVSLVNEMLTQMEFFHGVFIASTNLMDGLDQAALRRFDLKVKFDYMRPEQGWKLLQCYCVQLHLKAPSPDLRPKMNRLERLTPGDFAVVSRQHRFRPIGSPAMLVAALDAECALKEGPKPSIGFL
jgi:SpoVK/Ycf46/Vps4 family AAA+-type ATPase